MTLEGVHDCTFDAFLVGTGLEQSILASALAHSNQSVLHVDSNPFYGSFDASLSLSELLEAVAGISNPSSEDKNTLTQSPISSKFIASGPPPDCILAKSRAYALSLAPSIIPSAGRLVEAMRSSHVSDYVYMKLLGTIAMYSPNDAQSSPFKRVPFSKAHVFQDKSLSLPDKRRLMKFLLWAREGWDEEELYQNNSELPFNEFLSTKFSLQGHLADLVMYAVALLPSPNVPLKYALVRLRKHLRSAGVYGASPFLVAPYGGAGEISQGFCRSCAVNGGVYMLAQNDIQVVEKIPPQENFKVIVQDGSLCAKHKIISQGYENSSKSSEHTRNILRAIVLLEKPIDILEELPCDEDQASSKESNLFIFPPGSFGHPYTIIALQLGSDTSSCPDGQAVLYIMTTSDSPETEPKKILSPVVEALRQSPMWSLYYDTTDEYSNLPNSLEGGRADVAGWMEQAAALAEDKWKHITGSNENMYFVHDNNT